MQFKTKLGLVDIPNKEVLAAADAIRGVKTWETHGCSTPGCGYPDGKPCIKCGLVIQPKPKA